MKGEIVGKIISIEEKLQCAMVAKESWCNINERKKKGKLGKSNYYMAHIKQFP